LACIGLIARALAAGMEPDVGPFCRKGPERQPTLQLASQPEVRPGRTDLQKRPPGRFQLLDGDRVVFVGDTLIERAQASDYVETLLTARYPDRQIIFRNLGWSGDTVFGESRAGFGTAADGFEQLRRQIDALKPTVVVVGYGANSSYDGSESLAKF